MIQAESIIPLPAPYDLHRVHEALPFVLMKDGVTVRSVGPMGPDSVATLEAEDSRELRLFAATMRAAAAGFPWRPIDADVPRDGSGFFAFGRHDTDNGRHWRAGDCWYAIILWEVWTGKPPRWVFSKDGTPAWSEPTHYALPQPPHDQQAGADGC